MEKHIAVYLRVSSKHQDTRSQEPDLKRWAGAQDKPVNWYGDKFTGKTMARPGWSKLEADIRAGKVSTVVCWRLDRLGRTAKGLTAEESRTSGRPVKPDSRRKNQRANWRSTQRLANMGRSCRLERIRAASKWKIPVEPTARPQ